MKTEIRFEAIGGQGAHSAGKILAEAVVLGMGYNGNHFSSFGSEKRGAPVRSSVRLRRDGKPVRSAAPILAPDFLVIFHENLIRYSPNCCEGSHSGTIVIVNSPRPPELMRFPHGFRARTIVTVDALKVSRKRGAGLNAAMLGALSRFLTEVDREQIKQAFSRFFSHLGAEALERNLAAFDEASSRARTYDFSHFSGKIFSDVTPLPTLGYENAPIGGVIPNPGNTILKNLSHSRKGQIPQLDYERCIQCGYCDMVCPDYCFVWKQGEVEGVNVVLPGIEVQAQAQLGIPTLQGIDYQYCKGCQKCIEACPTQALKLVSDNEKNRTYSYARKFMKLTPPGD